jgi:hypothetical protein
MKTLIILLILVSCGKEASSTKSKTASQIEQPEEAIAYPSCLGNQCATDCWNSPSRSQYYGECMDKAHYPRDREVCRVKAENMYNECRRARCSEMCNGIIPIENNDESLACRYACVTR